MTLITVSIYYTHFHVYVARYSTNIYYFNNWFINTSSLLAVIIANILSTILCLFWIVSATDSCLFVTLAFYMLIQEYPLYTIIYLSAFTVYLFSLMFYLIDSRRCQ